ncbi:unnamed protein product [Brachionus calyciflorus]|uniref:orotate phosphoribosyltransferase n=1 Tax=Brachionus calyciflorus TaxID=104777 RepID=A0A813NSZ9_9BILA|nr:unnamed protein product [Brachionus calyciflorus]
MNRKELESFMDNLYEIGSVKFGEFYLSTGLKTPVYFDLRLIVSHPKVLQQASQLIQNIIETNKIKYDKVCGVPYGALALATVLCLDTEKPMIFKRKSDNDYKVKLVEGVYEHGDTCLLIEDTVVYGTSIIETCEVLRHHGLKVTDAITILDREQGGKDNLMQCDLKFYSVLKASDILEYLVKKDKLTQEKMSEIVHFLKIHSFQISEQ